MFHFKMNDEWDQCTNCGCSEFDGNEREWERVCIGCGMTSAYELFSYEKPPIPYYYKHENYFQKTIIANAISKGAPIGNIQEHLMIMFTKSLQLFFQKKKEHGRDNYPNYQYALYMLCRHLGVDILPFIKLPKMKKTLEAVKEDWLAIDPAVHG